VLIPENETSSKYVLQTFKLDCNRGYNVAVDDAIFEKDKEKKIFVSVLFAQLNRKSTALIIKTYKTFHLKEASKNNFAIEEVKE
ncbi:MAG TPA: hypothetical protein VJY62_03720, partial [Bacteroidia bacterium]|nr:hypothetical protein [Bacteroidia bacterium]